MLAHATRDTQVLALMQHNASNRKAEVLALFAEYKRLTDLEIAGHLEVPVNFITRARNQLVAEGTLVDTGERKVSIYGRFNIVWGLKS